jgi:O-antigen/teichoic acid export membrane protein
LVRGRCGGVVWLLLSNWITKSLSFIQMIILVRLLP